MEKMLVTQGLNELKTLDSRIDRAVQQAEFVVPSKKSDKNAKAGVTKEDYCDRAKASMQQIKDLIKRRENIKAAIIASNAVTEVEIAGQKMTVAKAIDTKNSMEYYKLLLENMKVQYSTSTEKLERHNKNVEEKIDQLVITAYGKDGKDKISQNDYDAIANPYKAANEAELVDPLKIKDEIDKLQTWVEEFESNVDAQLQISNCMTYIEV